MNLIVEQIPGWGDPEHAFAAIVERTGSFFLDSSLEGQSQVAYSFIGCEPFLRVQGTHRRTVYFERGQETTEAVDVFAAMRAQLRRFAVPVHPTIPFIGGAVGYLSYEYGAEWEDEGRPDSDAGRVEFGFYDGLLAFEHATRRWFLIASPVHDATGEEIRQRILSWFGPPADRKSRVHGSGLPPVPNMTRADYLAGVGRIRNYIAAGDVYQANLAQRFETEWGHDAYSLYLKIRRATPAPFGCFLRTSWGEILSSSPERFLCVKGKQVQTRPIKGTRRRGTTAGENKRLAEELLGSAKERAELLMIVDLERNDLGRVCECGTISVGQLYDVEFHPTVIHLVATVEGMLRDECDIFDLLRASFPGGSITGAPKIRAMQIIRELEPAPRGVYTGALGYLGFDGSCDLSIAIRTVVLQQGRASYHVGAGIVWDSDPESEYEETLIKGRGLEWAIVGKEPL